MKTFPTLIPVIGLAVTVTVHAEEQPVDLSNMVISADFRPTQLSEAAVSVTAIDEDTLEARNAQHIEQVINLAPNVNMSSGSSRGKYFQIRGIGERSQFNAPINPSVGLVVDGVDFSRTGGAGTLFDVEQVEVLRGPQGTKFGTNALAGSIFIKGKEPTEEFDFHAEAGVADYDAHSLGIAVSGPLIENKLLGRIAVHGHQSDGYMENAFLGRDDTMIQDEMTFRGKLKWLVNDELTIDFSLLHLDIDNGYDAFTLDNSRTTYSNEPGRDEQVSDAAAVKANWQLSDAVILQSEVTHMTSDIVYSFDLDWSYPDQFDPADGPFSGFFSYGRKRENASFDVRLLSDQAGRIFGGTTDWTVGIYHIDQDERFDQNNRFNNSLILSQGDYDTENTALYSQFDIHLSDDLTLVTGARIERFQADYSDSSNLRISTGDTMIGGKIGLNYQANDDHFLYTSLSRGYKSGGVNNDASLSTDFREYDTEYNHTLEAGIKSFWLEGDITTEFTAFYTVRSDAQTKNTVQIDGGTYPSFNDNAEKAVHQGIEASADWLVNDQVRLLASLGLLDAEFKKVSKDRDLEGRQVAHAPNYTFSIGTEIYPSYQWTLRANIEGKDQFYFSDSENGQSDAYAIVNASAQYTHQNWTVNFWARNLFDKDYATRGLIIENDPTLDAKRTYTQFGEPRVIGVTLKYDY